MRPEPVDFGPPEGLKAGRVVVEGEDRARGRALSIADELPPELQNAMSLLLRLFEAARYSGYSLSNMERVGRAGVCRRDEPTERAEAARRHLAAIEAHVGAFAWAAIVDLLLWQKSADTWAYEARTRGYPVDRKAARPVLLAELAAMSAMRPPKRCVARG